MNKKYPITNYMENKIFRYDEKFQFLFTTKYYFLDLNLLFLYLRKYKKFFKFSRFKNSLNKQNSKLNLFNLLISKLNLNTVFGKKIQNSIQKYLNYNNYIYFFSFSLNFIDHLYFCHTKFIILLKKFKYIKEEKLFNFSFYLTSKIVNFSFVEYRNNYKKIYNKRFIIK